MLSALPLHHTSQASACAFRCSHIQAEALLLCRYPSGFTLQQRSVMEDGLAGAQLQGRAKPKPLQSLSTTDSFTGSGGQMQACFLECQQPEAEDLVNALAGGEALPLIVLGLVCPRLSRGQCRSSNVLATWSLKITPSGQGRTC